MRSVILLLLCTFCSSLFAFQFNCEESKKIDTNKITGYIHQLEIQDSTSLVDGKVISTKSSNYENLFKKCIQNKQPLEALNDQELHKLYKGIKTIAFYTSNIAHTNYMQAVLNEKFKRGEKNKRLINRMHKAYVQTRQFQQANQLEKQYSEVKFSPIPDIESSKVEGRSLLHIENKGQKLVQRPFVLPKGGHIIVISSPLCNPSRRYLSWLQTNPKLLSVFAEHSTWILPVDGQFNVNKVQESNKKNTPIKMLYTYKESDWPEISYWGTPTFYFYQDGKLKQQIVGWPKEGREKQLIKALKDVHLLNKQYKLASEF